MVLRLLQRDGRSSGYPDGLLLARLLQIFFAPFSNSFCTLSTIFNHYQPFCENEGLASFTHNCSLCWSKQCFFSLLLLFCSFH